MRMVISTLCFFMLLIGYAFAQMIDQVYVFYVD